MKHILIKLNDTWINDFMIHKKIRLTQDVIDSICTSFKLAFLKDDELWIFGSRVNPNAKGGDIDLFVKTHYKDAQDVVKAKINFLTQLFMRIEEQKVDVVVQFGDYYLPIYDVAQTEGIRLL